MIKVKQKGLRCDRTFYVKNQKKIKFWKMVANNQGVLGLVNN